MASSGSGSAPTAHEQRTHRTGAVQPAEPRSHPLLGVQQLWKTSLERVRLEVNMGWRQGSMWLSDMLSVLREGSRSCAPAPTPADAQPRAKPLPRYSDLAKCGKLVPLSRRVSRQLLAAAWPARGEDAPHAGPAG